MIRSTDDSAFGSSDETDHRLNGLGTGEIPFQRLDGILQLEPLLEQDLIGRADFLDLLGREAAPPQTDRVQAAQIGVVAVRHTKRRHVLNHRRSSTDHGRGPNPAVLMDAGQATDHSVVLDRNMPRQRRTIG